MTSISKNVYNDKLDDIVNKHNNTYHRTIKMKPVDVKSNHLMIKNLNLKLVMLLEHHNIFAKGYVPNWYEEFFMIKKKLKTLCRRQM